MYLCKPIITSGISGNGPYTVEHGTTVTITANPEAHHHLVANSWSDNVTVSTANPLEATINMTGAAEVTANFAINTYTLTLATDPTNGSKGTLDVVRNNNNELPAGVRALIPTTPSTKVSMCLL